jgi:hypothetical protein
VSENLKGKCSNLQSAIEEFFKDLLIGVTAREDSRAFGAMVEKQITSNWVSICNELDVKPLDIPGRRTIFDCAFSDSGYIYGLDVKTKDLDATSYSDGGICAVGNLLKFLANDKGVFLIVEVGHKKSESRKDSRDIEYIHVAPFSCLPAKSFRIENLGTGQVRLNHSVSEVFDEIDWKRTNQEFFEIFTELTKTHYLRVIKDANTRIESIETFQKNGYERFSFGRK